MKTLVKYITLLLVIFLCSPITSIKGEEVKPNQLLILDIQNESNDLSFDISELNNNAFNYSHSIFGNMTSEQLFFLFPHRESDDIAMAGNPAIELTKEATSGPTDLGSNNYTISWTVVMSNTGDETVSVNNWWDDFEGINNTNGVPMTVVPAGSSITSMSGMSNGAAVTIGDANTTWNGMTANQNVMAVYPFNLLVGESITVIFQTQYILVSAASIYNETGGDAEWDDNGTITPVPVGSAFGAEGGLPGAVPTATILKEVDCQTYDQSTEKHYIEYTLTINNTGPLDLADLSLQDSLVAPIGGEFTIVNTSILSTEVQDNMTNVATSNSTKFGLGNNSNYTGIPNSPLDDTEVLQVGGSSVATLNQGEQLILRIQYELEIVSSNLSTQGVLDDWIDQNCVAYENRAKIIEDGQELGSVSSPINSPYRRNFICPMAAEKTLISIVQTNVTPPQYKAEWNVILRKSPNVEIENSSAFDNFELSNNGDISIILATVECNESTSAACHVNDYSEGPWEGNVTDPYFVDVGSSWQSAPVTNSYSSRYRLAQYKLTTDFEYTGSTPLAMVDLCNEVTWVGDVSACGNHGAYSFSLVDDLCLGSGGLPVAQPSASIVKEVDCQTYDQSTEKHFIEYTLTINNTGPLDLADLSLQDSLVAPIGGEFTIVNTSILSTEVQDNMTNVATSNSTKFGLGNNSNYTGIPNSPLDDTEVLQVGGTAIATLNKGEQLVISIQYELEIVSSNLSTQGVLDDWIDQNCVAYENRARIIEDGQELGSVSSPINSPYRRNFICPLAAEKTLISIVQTNVTPPQYSAEWNVILRKSPNIEIENSSAFDNFELSNSGDISIILATVECNESTSAACHVNDYSEGPWEGNAIDPYFVDVGSSWQNAPVTNSYSSRYRLAQYKLTTNFEYTGSTPLDMVDLCNEVTWVGDVSACGNHGAYSFSLVDEACTSLPVAQPSASISKEVGCQTYNPSTEKHYIEYLLTISNTGPLDLVDLSLQDSLVAPIGGEFTIVNTSILSTEVQDNMTNVPTSNSTKFGLGNNGNYTGIENTPLDDTEVLQVGGSSIATLNQGEQLVLRIQYELEIVSSNLSTQGVLDDWIDQNCVAFENRATINEGGNELGTISSPINSPYRRNFICPLAAEKTLISIVQTNVTPPQYSAEWDVVLRKSPNIEIENSSVFDNFELSNNGDVSLISVTVECNESTSAACHVNDYSEGPWEGNATDPYFVDPGSSWQNAPVTNSYSARYRLAQYKLTTDFEYIGSTPVDQAIISNEGIWQGVIPGCGGNGPFPYIIETSASALTSGVDLPGTELTKSLDNIVCNLDGTVTATYDLSFENTSNQNGLSQDYTYVNFQMYDDFAQVVADESYPFTSISGTVNSLTLNGVGQSINGSFDGGVLDENLMTGTITLAPDDVVLANLSITFTSGSFNPTTFFKNTYCANFDIEVGGSIVPNSNMTDCVNGYGQIPMECLCDVSISATGGSQCTGGNINLTSTTTDGTGPFTYGWSGPNSYSSTDEDPEILNLMNTHNGDYTIVVTDGNGCTASQTITVSVINTPNIDDITDQSICSGDSYTLPTIIGANLTSNAGYFTATGGSGSQLAVGSMINTAQTIYIYDATTGSTICSDEESFEITVTSVNAPIGTPGNRCSEGPVDLGASGCTSGVLNWYAASTGGSSLGTGTNFTTPSISNTTTYYVDCTENGCTSGRTAVIATVNTTPSAPTGTPGNRCGEGTVDLGASGCTSGVLNWYATSTGGSSLGTGTSFTTPIISSTATFYVDCTENGCTSERSLVVATINSIPTIVSNATCAADGLSYSITVTTTAADGLASTVGMVTGTAPNFTVSGITVGVNPTLTATNSVTTCSAMESVTSPMCSCPAGSPTVTGAERCGPGMVTLSAASGTNCDELRWYTALTGGIAVNTGTSYSVSITGTTSYYVSCYNTAQDCESDPRQEVLATMNAIPTIVSNATCAADGLSYSITVTTTAADGLASTVGMVTGTAPNFTVSGITVGVNPTLTATNSVTTCSAMESVTSPMCSCPAGSPTVTGAERCGPGMVTLSAASGTNCDELRWYTALTGGIAVNTGTSYSVSITGTTSYYVSCYNTAQDCESDPRQEVLATMNAIPTIVSNATCAADGLSYSITVTTTAADGLASTVGMVTGTAPNFTVSGITVGVNTTLTATNSVTTCSAMESVTSPMCCEVNQCFPTTVIKN